MKKILALFVIITTISCNDKEIVALPKAAVSIVKEVYDHSPVYVFFRINANDTLAELNRKNIIGTTNWIFNIDKKLPLNRVIPEIVFMQNKKKNGMHTNEKAENYFSYADSIGKNLAFVPFTKIQYKIEQPKNGIVVYFTKDNRIIVDNIEKKLEIEKTDLLKLLLTFESDKPKKYYFCHDKNSSYEKFIQNTIFITQLKLQISTISLTNEEFIF
jgi:hypothetical protein